MTNTNVTTLDVPLWGVYVYTVSWGTNVPIQKVSRETSAGEVRQTSKDAAS
jgi:hypothetical protein